ncbi:MAG: bile acid:sodium symporter family protein [Rubrobacteraceae bacterium]
MESLTRLSNLASKYFAFWVILGSIIAFLIPVFSGLTSYIAPLLGLVMFGMGLTLTVSDFVRVFKRPFYVVVGVAAQFTVMPILALVLAVVLNLPPQLAVGVLLVGCCPGGTASNVITYLARGDVPLSVTMTSVSTVLAPLATPLLMLLLAGSWLPVNAGELFVSIVQIVLLPVLAGVLVNTLFGRTVQAVRPAMPLVSVLAILIIVMVIVAANRDNLLTVGPIVFLVVVAHNLAGLLLGYSVARVMGVDVAGRRAISVEVGMQNSGLATALAAANFGGLAALPGALFSIWHNISGPALATYWSRRPIRASRAKRTVA